MKKAMLGGFFLVIAGLLFAGTWAMAQAPAAAPAGGAPAVAAPAAAAPAASGALQLEGGEKKEEEAHSSSLWEVITRAGPFGVLIWFFLVVCSVISVALIVDSFVTIKEKNIMPPGLVENVRAAMEQGDLFKAIQFCNDNPGPLANILRAGFAQVEEGFEVVQDAVGVAADTESEKLLSRVTYLSVISNTTPMLGLIGTVQGMIMAFANLGTKAAGAAQQALLALNISHGLWATAVGLSTAVPATIFFYYFKNRSMRIILRMEALTLDLIKSLRNVEVVAE